MNPKKIEPVDKGILEVKQSRDEADIVLGQPVEAKARVYGDNDILPKNDLNVERYQSTFSHDL